MSAPAPTFKKFDNLWGSQPAPQRITRTVPVAGTGDVLSKVRQLTDRSRAPVLRASAARKIDMSSSDSDLSLQGNTPPSSSGSSSNASPREENPQAHFLRRSTLNPRPSALESSESHVTTSSSNEEPVSTYQPSFQSRVPSRGGVVTSSLTSLPPSSFGPGSVRGSMTSSVTAMSTTGNSSAAALAALSRPSTATGSSKPNTTGSGGVFDPLRGSALALSSAPKSEPKPEVNSAIGGMGPGGVRMSTNSFGASRGATVASSVSTVIHKPTSTVTTSSVSALSTVPSTLTASSIASIARSYSPVPSSALSSSGGTPRTGSGFFGRSAVHVRSAVVSDSDSDTGGKVFGIEALGVADSGSEIESDTDNVRSPTTPMGMSRNESFVPSESSASIMRQAIHSINDSTPQSAMDSPKSEIASDVSSVDGGRFRMGNINDLEALSTSEISSEESFHRPNAATTTKPTTTGTAAVRKPLDDSLEVPSSTSDSSPPHRGDDASASDSGYSNDSGLSGKGLARGAVFGGRIQNADELSALEDSSSSSFSASAQPVHVQQKPPQVSVARTTPTIVTTALVPAVQHLRSGGYVSAVSQSPRSILSSSIRESIYNDSSIQDSIHSEPGSARSRNGSPRKRSVSILVDDDNQYAEDFESFTESDIDGGSRGRFNVKGVPNQHQPNYYQPQPLGSRSRPPPSEGSEIQSEIDSEVENDWNSFTKGRPLSSPQVSPIPGEKGKYAGGAYIETPLAKQRPTAASSRVPMSSIAIQAEAGPQLASVEDIVRAIEHHTHRGIIEPFLTSAWDTLSLTAVEAFSKQRLLDDAERSVMSQLALMKKAVTLQKSVAGMKVPEPTKVTLQSTKERNRPPTLSYEMALSIVDNMETTFGV